VAALSPLGRVPRRRPRRGPRFRPRYRLRLRRAIPALVMILALCVLAGGVWLRVLDRVDAGAAPAGCGTADGATLAGGALDPRSVKVRVYNSTAREGLARTVSGLLRSRGFAVVVAANDPLIDIRQVAGSAEVRYGPAGARQADLVRRQVPGAKLYRDAREDSTVDLALGGTYRRLSTSAELARSAKGRQGLVARSAPPAASPSC
jgi:hypothetical protein